jgi:hypothetical protein
MTLRVFWNLTQFGNAATISLIVESGAAGAEKALVTFFDYLISPRLSPRVFCRGSRLRQGLIVPRS